MNANNMALIKGRINGTPEFISDRNGKEFSCRFVVGVKRSFKDREGRYGYDDIECRIQGERRMTLAHLLVKGMDVSVAGETRTGHYDRRNEDGSIERVYTRFIAVDDVRLPRVADGAVTAQEATAEEEGILGDEDLFDTLPE